LELIGRKIAGKFVVESEIGSGGMGTVFRARQIDLDKDIAIKVLRQSLAAEPEFAGRFKREAKAASKIDHPNSMRVIDFGQEPDGLLYIAMELLDGKSLHDIIKEEAPLGTARIVDLTRQTLAALAAAHDIGILHRDLKPENIIVVRKRTDEGHESETVKVCDFGIAKLSTTGSSATPGGSKLTSAGAIVGTPDYMSPEQARGASDVDGRTDVYSVGVMMYQMMTRKLPFVAETPLGVVLMHLNEPPRPPSEHVPEIDPRLEVICLKAMSKKPEERYASARDMRQALSLEGEVSLPPAQPSSKRKLVLATEESAITQTATAMAAPRAPMRSVPSAKEMLDAPGVPKPGFGGVWIVLGVLAIGGGAAYLYSRPSKAPVVAPPVPTAPIASSAPKPTTTISAPIAIVSASAPVVHASASTSAPAASTGVRPTTTGPPIASTVASTTASAPPPPPPPPSPYHVYVGNVTADKVSPSAVSNALPLDRFQRCYRDGATGQAKVPFGVAKLHIAMSNTTTEATFAGAPELAPIGTCIVNAANKITVDLPQGSGTADIDLTFKTD
jgi:serine/threonine-protein kinase